MGVALVFLALPRGLAWLTGAFALLGMLGGLLDVAINDSAVAVERGYGRPILSSIHGMWSVGLLVGSAAGAGAAALHTSPVLHFGVVAAVVGAGSVWVLRWLLPPSAPVFTPPPTDPVGGAPSAHALRSTAVVLLGLIGFGSFLCEGASADWSAVYLRETLGVGAGLAGVAFVAYSGGMVVSRFVADRLTARFGPVAVVRTCGLSAAAGLSLGLLTAAPAAAIAAFAVLGASLGPVVPTAFSAAGNTPVRGADTALGWVVTMGYLGTVVGPVLIGAIATGLGLRAALGVPVVFALIVAAAAARVRPAAGGDRAATD
jgi:predicted MFS family arabinose efflux permease